MVSWSWISYSNDRSKDKMVSMYLFVVILSAISLTSVLSKSNETIHMAIGSNDNQDEDKTYIMKNVMLAPAYNPNDPPRNIHGRANVDVDWYDIPKILSIDETDNKITFQLEQYMEWEDSRIIVNYSAIPSLNQPFSYMKMPPEKIKEIWHPNRDMYTDDILEWKSLYEPFWFQSAGLFKCPLTRDCDLSPNVPLIYAFKMWRVTMYCKFDFFKFPLDTQHCKFRQAFGSTSDTVGLFYYPPYSLTYKNDRNKTVGNWTFSAAGFSVSIKLTGTPIESDTIDQKNIGSFGFDIKLERIVQPYLLQYYIPCITIVLVSMISFLIPLTAIPGRVTLVVTLFLTLTNIFTVEMVRFK